MRQFIDLVKRIELANPGLGALQIAAMIRKTKYNSFAWKQLLPDDTPGPVAAKGGVKPEDVTTLTGDFDVALPEGGTADPSHVVVAIEAGHEKKPAGYPFGDAPGLSQRDIASWAGDVGSAAAEWMTAHPLPQGGTSKEDYMTEFAPESDLIGDVDGVAISSASDRAGFAIDLKQPLSSNLEAFYFPAKARLGKNRRFHIFCAAEGLALTPDNVKLATSSQVTIDAKVQTFADFFSKNDPDILTWVVLASKSVGLAEQLFGDPVTNRWIERKNDWKWFAERFRSFVDRNLKTEGA
jgi:hypothetical protein